MNNQLAMDMENSNLMMGLHLNYNLTIEFYHKEKELSKKIN